MRAKLILLTVTLLLLLMRGEVLATPTPPYVFVNHDTKQCAVDIHGDDCRWCEPPEGWEELGLEGQVQCPEGYTRLERIELKCVGYKTKFCCTSGSHPGGDCEDLVINESEERCAFVDDIETCTLPEGWATRPADMHEWAWGCPYTYKWEQVICLSETPVPTISPTHTPTSEPTATPTSTPVTATFTPVPTTSVPTLTPMSTLAPVVEPPDETRPRGCLGPAVSLMMFSVMLFCTPGDRKFQGEV